MAFSFGPIVYKVTTEGLIEGKAAAQSINQNMTGAAAAASRMSKSATAALNQTAKGTFGESVAYGQARGATGQTGASARDFANQAQGLGGLVRLYATFAANIFAVGAAFEALKRSFQFEQLQRASEAFAVTTGKNLSGISAELKKLSEGTLTDKAAQQIANYGTSAGFTSDQMRRIIVVAKGASQALGRDMGDAIDRLMRGAGKLNPELLDELGLLTRTKAAYAEYGKAVGKSANDLTGFEKTQAFTNAVLKEGEEKFGAVAKVIQASPFERFTASLLSMATSVGSVFNKVFVPILDFFSNNPAAMIAAMAAAFGKLILTALPALNSLGEGAKKAAETQAKALTEMKGRAEAAAKGIAETKNQALALSIDQYQHDIKAQREHIAESIAAEKAAASAYLANAKNKNETIKKIARDGQVDLDKLNASLSSPKLNADSRAYLEDYKARTAEVRDSQKSLVENTKALKVAQDTVLASAQDNVVVQSKLNAVLEKRAQIASVKASGLAAVTETAQIGTLRQSFEHLGVVMNNVRAAHETLNQNMGIFGKTLTNLSVVSTGVVGTFKIMTASVSTLLNVLSPWLLTIGLVIAAFEGLISITGGVSKKLEETKTAQEEFSKALNLTGEQVLNFEKLQKTVDGSADSFLKISSYSTSLFNGIIEGLSKTTSAFAAFAADSSGWWSSIKEGTKSLFGMDTTISTQVSQLRSSIFTVLSSVSPQDQKKVEQAIVSALPTASSLDQVFSQLKNLTSAQLATFGTNLVNNLNTINTSLKYNQENLKTSIESWKNLGDAVDKYNEKQIAKDPKLKDIVQDLHSINLAYAAAKTEKDKALVLSGLDVEVQNKLVKLAADRGVNLQAWSRWIDEARATSKKYAEEEQAAADKKKQVQDETAISYIKDQDTFLSKLKDMQQLQEKITKNNYTDINEVGGSKSRADDIRRAQALRGQLDSYLSDATSAADKAQDSISTAILKGYKSGLDQGFDDWMKRIRNKIAELAGLVSEDLKNALSGKKVVDALKTQLDPLAGKTTISQIDQDRETRKMLSGGLGRTVSSFTKETEGQKAEKALAALKAQKDVHEKIAKSFEFQIQTAIALEAKIKRIADIEKETVGFIDAQTAAKQEAAGIARTNLEMEKRLEEARIEYTKAIESRTPNALKNYTDAVAAAVATRDVTTESLKLETLRSQLLREKVQFEKLYLDVMKEALGTSLQIADLESQSGILSENAYNLRKSENVLALANLEIAKQQKSLDDRKAINAQKGPATPAETAVFEAEQKILDIQKQRAIVTKQITDEQSKQKQFWDQVVAVNSAIVNSLSIQLKYSLQLISYSSTLAKSQKAESLTALEVAKSYRERVSALGLQIDSEEELIVREESLLELTDKIYQQRVQMYQLASKNGSGADFLKTIGQGFTIEAENFKQSMKSAVQTLVDGAIAALDAPINYIVETLKGGGKLNAKAMMQSIADSIKNSLFEYAGNTVKNFIRQTLSSLFGDKSLTLQQVTKDAAEKFAETNKVIDILNQQFNPLINALKSLENALLNSLPKTDNEKAFAGINFGQNEDSYNFWLSNTTNSLENFDSSVQSGMDSIGDFGQQMNKVAIGTGQAFSSIIDFIASRASGIASGAGATVGSIAGNALGGGPIGNMAGSLITSAAGSAITGGLSAAWTAGSLAYAGVGAAGPVIAGSLTTSIAAGLAAIPVAGWVSLGAVIIAGIISGIDDGPAMRTGVWRSAVTPSTNGTAPLGKGNSLFQSTSAFGAFGITDDKWFSDKDMGEAVKAFLNNITTIDNAISNAVGPEVTQKIATNLAAVTTNFEAGMEHEGVTFGSILLNRYKTVINTVADGFGLLLDGFDGTGQELATFVLGIINMSKVMADATAMNQIFGESFNLDALKGQQKAGELITETFTRLTTEFTITNQVVDAMGLNVVDVFGAVGLAGVTMRENLIAATGGMQALTDKVTFYLDNFFTDAEKNAKKLSSANSAITAKFGTDAPKTRADYNAAVTKALIDGNFELYNSLLTLAPAFDVVYDAAEELTKNTEKLNNSLSQFNITLDEDFVSAIQNAGNSVDDFISNVQNLAEQMLTPEQLAQFSVAGATAQINDPLKGYTATTGLATPTDRATFWSQFINEEDPAKKAAIAKFWKSFDTIFDNIDDSVKKAEEAQKSLSDNLKLVGDAASLAGMSFSDDLIKSLEATEGAAKELADNLNFFVDQFLTDAEKTVYSTSSATEKISKAGLVIPKTREDFVKYINSLSESQKLIALSLLPAYDALYDAQDAEAEKLKEQKKLIADNIKTATGILYSGPEQSALAFSTASETVNAAFEKLGKQTPTTVEGFREIYESLDDAGKIALLDVVPAFGIMMDTIAATAEAVKKAADAMQAALDSVSASTGSFIDEIQDSIGTAEQRYNKYKSRSEENSKQIDEINKLSDEQITEKVRTGELTPEKIAKISDDAVENAKKAWGQLTDEQKQILGPAFETYIEQLEKNATDVVKRVGEIAKKIAGEPIATPNALTTPSPTSTTSTSPTSDPGTAVANAITTGGTTAANSIQTSMTTGSTAIVDAMTSGSIIAGNNLSAGIQIGSLYAAKNLEDVFTRVMANIAEASNISQTNREAIGDQLVSSMQNNVNKQAQAVDQQQSIMTDFAAKLLEAAQGMLAAAAGQQQAANTPQQINVNVDLSGMPTNTGNEVTG